MAITYISKSIPKHGELVEVSPNLFWWRSPMPFALDHINLWLIKEQDSWTAIDTGMNLKAANHLMN